jgi:hypothetical protein
MASKLKNADILVINESLLYLSQKNTAAWYQISKNLRAIKVAVKEIEDSKNDIIENMAEKDKDGQIVYEGEGRERKVVWKDIKKADEQWKQLMTEEAKKIDWFKFGYEKFGDTTDIDALAIEPLIDVCL